MKHLVSIIAFSFVLSGCSSSNVTVNTTTNAANQSNANANYAAMTNTNSSAVQPYNGVQNLNPNAFNATNDNLKVVNPAPKKDELPYGQRYAPDDSIVSSGSRGKDFFEARTFKSHPTLAKVEKITDGTTTKFKVFLKNGKVLDAPADKMDNFTAMSPENILEVVGMQPKNKTVQQKDIDKKAQADQ